MCIKFERQLYEFAILRISVMYGVYGMFDKACLLLKKVNTALHV